MWMYLILLACTLYYGLYRYKRRRLFELAAKLPSCRGQLPIVGLSKMMAGDRQHILSTTKYFSNETIRCDGICTGWLINIFVVMMVDITDIEFIASKFLNKDDIHRLNKPLTGDGIIFAPEPIWRPRRKTITPCFNLKTLNNFIEVFSTESTNLVESLDKVADGREISIFPFLSNYTLSLVGKTIMGVDLNVYQETGNLLVRTIEEVHTIIAQRMFKFWQHPDFLFKLFSEYKAQEKGIKYITGFVDEVIQKHKEIKRKHKLDDNDEFENRRKSLLEMMIDRTTYDDVELRDEVITMIIAGSDTSAIAMGYTLKLLAKYPEIQDKVYEELCDNFGDSDRPAVKEDLKKLVYLERVLKESMRLFPPVTIITRKIDKEVTLPSGHVLPNGCGVVISLWGLLRNPKYWGPDAEQFDPDRFSPERFTDIQARCFSPFSLGPRACIGNQFAMISLKMALTTILRKFIITGERESGPIPEIKSHYEIMMKADDDFKVGLVKRKPQVTRL